MSKEKYDEWFDKAFDEAFERAARDSSFTSPSLDTKQESWRKVKQTFEQQNRRKKRRRTYQFSGIIAASMLLGTMISITPNITEAISPIYQQIKKWGDGNTSFLLSSFLPTQPDQAKTSPPPEDIEPTDSHLSSEMVGSASTDDYDMTLDQVKAKLTFKYKEFTYIPEGYQYNDVFVLPLNEDDPIDEMHIQYTNEEGKIIMVQYTNLANKEISINASTYNPEKVTLDSGEEAVLSLGRSSDIQFVHDQVYIRIMGELSKEDLLKIANSLP